MIQRLLAAGKGAGKDHEKNVSCEVFLASETILIALSLFYLLFACFRINRIRLFPEIDTVPHSDVHWPVLRPADTDWTGAEIKSCCRLAALLDLPLVQAAQNIVPVAVTAAEAVSKLRTWASGRCLSADQPGIYRAAASKPRRNVTREKIDPLSN